MKEKKKSSLASGLDIPSDSEVRKSPTYHRAVSAQEIINELAGLYNLISDYKQTENILNSRLERAIVMIANYRDVILSDSKVCPERKEKGRK